MSYPAQYNRIAYIDRRLRYKKDYPSANTLAADYLAYFGDEFSTKTFKRDIEWLRDQNAPIEYDASRKGYYYSDETFELPSMLLTSGDLLALLVIDRALYSYRNSPFYERLQSVFNELKKRLPDKVSIDSGELAANFSVIAEPVTDINEQTWICVQKGLEQGRSLDIEYLTPGFDSTINRRIDPYHLIGQKGEWYLLSRSHRDEAIRVYALARIKGCTVNNNRFNLPEDFHPKDYFDPAFGVFTKEDRVKISIKFYPPAASVIKERIWHPDQEIEELNDGSIILKYETNQQTQTLYWISGWGYNAEILEPEELRQKAADWFLKTKNRYFPKK